MLLIKICYILTILFIYFEKINGIKTNMMLSLSKIENIGNATIATYDVNTTDDIFPLLLEVDDYIVIEDIFEINKNIIGFRKYVTLKTGKSLWNLTMTFHRTRNELCEKLSSYEANMDEILNEVFQCQNQVTGYLSQFYYIKEEMETHFNTSNRVEVPFPTRISIFWLITRKGLILLNNDKNYEQFLKSCHSIPYRIYWIVSVGVLLSLIALVSVFIEKIKIPKICIRRANKVIMVRPARTLEI